MHEEEGLEDKKRTCASSLPYLVRKGKIDKLIMTQFHLFSNMHVNKKLFLALSTSHHLYVRIVRV